MAWHLAPSLAACRLEADRIAPARSKVSDGTIGDTRHSTRKSDHNPGARDRVHALDLTHDPAGGFDAHHHAERLRAAQDRRVSYLISNARIAGPGARGGGWHWRPYTGSNPHVQHIHISIHSTVAAETDTRSWWPVADRPFPPQPAPTMPPEDDPMLIAWTTNPDQAWLVTGGRRFYIAKREELDRLKAAGIPEITEPLDELLPSIPVGA